MALLAQSKTSLIVAVQQESSALISEEMHPALVKREPTHLLDIWNASPVLLVKSAQLMEQLRRPVQLVNFRSRPNIAALGGALTTTHLLLRLPLVLLVPLEVIRITLAILAVLVQLTRVVYSQIVPSFFLITPQQEALLLLVLALRFHLRVMASAERIFPAWMALTYVLLELTQVELIVLLVRRATTALTLL